jgi:hypothetical protein
MRKLGKINSPKLQSYCFNIGSPSRLLGHLREGLVGVCVVPKLTQKEV